MAGWLQGKVAQGGPEAPSAASQATLRVAIRERGKERFGHPFALSAPGAGGFALASADDGETTVAWQHGESVRLRVRDRNGSWSAEQTVAAEGAFLVDLVAAPDGMAVLLYGHEGMLIAQTRAPGGPLGLPQPLAPTEEVMWSTVAAADGQAMVAWGPGCYPGGPRTPLKVSLLNELGLFGTPQEVGNSACASSGIRSAIAPSGEATLLVNGDLSRNVIRISTRRAGEPFPRSALIGPPSRKLAGGDLGATAEGHTTVVWGRATGFGPSRAMSRPPGGEYGAASRLAGKKMALHEFAVGGEGTAVATAQRRRGTAVVPKIYAIYREGTGGRFEPPQVVARGLRRTALASSGVAVGADGQATIIWSVPRPRHVEERGIVVRSCR